MIRLTCSGISFYSQKDEDSFFLWGQRIPSFLRWEQDTMVIKGAALSDRQLKEIIALFYRYQVPMKQLRPFETSKNKKWLKDRKMYWHQSLYGKI